MKKKFQLYMRKQFQAIKSAWEKRPVLAYRKYNDEFIEVEVDKLVFDGEAQRYLLLLTRFGQKSGDRIVLPFDETAVDEELVVSSTSHSRRIISWLEQLGLNIFSIRVLKRGNTSDSAQCIVKGKLFFRTVNLSTLEAVFLSIDNPAILQISKKLVSAYRVENYQMSNIIEKIESQNLFSPFLSDNDYFNEVVM